MRVRHGSRVALIFNTSLPFNRAVFGAVGEYVRQQDLNWTLSVARQLPPLKDLDGCIIDVESCTPAIQGVLQQADLPVVYVASAQGAAPAFASPLVCPDNAALVALAIAHLRESGFMRFAFFSRSRYQGFAWAKERVQAFQSILKAPGNAVWQGEAALTEHEEELQTLNWLRRMAARTGIVAVNDSCARLLLTQCQQIGRDVPGDLSIVGIDHDALVSALSQVEITSVQQDYARIGQAAVTLLGSQLQGGQQCVAQTLIPPAGLYIAGSSDRSNALLHRALDFMEANIGQSIKSEQVADHLGISRATLERMFLRHLGLTFHKELLRQRIERARQLLRGGSMTVTKVAHLSGFRTAQYMHYVFRRELGISPTEAADLPPEKP